jgi:PAS domain S-box-containing protein
VGSDETEAERLRAAALANAESIVIARRRAESEMLAARDALEQKTVELEEQREWFAVTLASIGDAVITTDTHARITFLNPVAETLTGWSLQDARGRPLEDMFRIINEVTGEAAGHPVRVALAEGRIVELANHTALVRRDGTTIAIEDSAAPIRNSSGEISGAVMVFHDVTRRRRAETAVREASEHLQLALAVGSLGDWSWEASSDVVSFGQGGAEIFGLPAKSQITWTELKSRLMPEDGEQAGAAVERALAEHSDYDIEYRVRRPSGERCWVAARGRGIYSETGAVLGMLGIVQDITARKQTEEVRRYLAAVVEGSDDGIITKDLDGIIASWNRGAERIFGYSATEIIGKPITTLIPRDRLDEETTILQRLRRGDRIDHYETVRVRKDGTPFDVSLTVSPIRDLRGGIIGASKIVRDISQRKRMELMLREETRALELLNSTGVAIAGKLELAALAQTVTDAATQLSGAKFGAFFYNVTNAQGESLFLYALSGAPREAFEKFGLPRNTAIFDPTFRGTGTVRSADITQDCRYGKNSPHRGMPQGHPPVRSYLAVPVISRSGKVIGGLFFGHPEVAVFTERAQRLVEGVAAQAAVAMDNAQLFEALHETDRRKDEFLATLAHELRNPLAPIRQAALISGAANATDTQKRWSHEVITRQVQTMALLLDDLLDISRISSGTLELRTENIPLAAVIEAAVETARPLIDSKRHLLTIELPDAPVVFAADRLRLAQVFSNLLTNAAKYTDPGGRIRLHAAIEDDSVRIAVADSGIGISAEALERVFQMFSQVKSAQDRSEGGLGIGLALTKGLVALHGGTIEAHSAGLGHGTEFIVRLPRRVLHAASVSERAPSGAGSGLSRRVLIADDNRDAAESLAILFRMEGHDVTVAHDGRQALAVYQAVRPNVVLLDIGMPELSGYEVAQQIRRSASKSAVMLIALTGWGQKSDKARALAAGFDHHFTKPVDPDAVAALLRSRVSD